LSGTENLPQLVRATMKVLDLLHESDSKDAVKKSLRALASLVHGLAEMQGQLGSGHGQHPTARFLQDWQLVPRQQP